MVAKTLEIYFNVLQAAYFEVATVLELLNVTVALNLAKKMNFFVFLFTKSFTSVISSNPENFRDINTQEVL